MLWFTKNAVGAQNWQESSQVLANFAMGNYTSSEYKFAVYPQSNGLNKFVWYIYHSSYITFRLGNM